MFHEILLLFEVLHIVTAKIVSSCDSSKLPVSFIKRSVGIYYETLLQDGIDEKVQSWDCSDKSYSYGSVCNLECKNDLIAEIEVFLVHYHST